MELTYDYRYITVANKARVKERAKEFKQRYTENDIFQAMFHAFGERKGLHGYEDIVKCTVSAFEKDFYYEENSYSITMILIGCRRMYRVRFYCDDNLDVNVSDPVLYELETYKLDKEEN